LRRAFEAAALLPLKLELDLTVEVCLRAASRQYLMQLGITSLSAKDIKVVEATYSVTIGLGNGCNRLCAYYSSKQRPAHILFSTHAHTDTRTHIQSQTSEMHRTCMVGSTIRICC
jgi:hypothetical protein